MTRDIAGRRSGSLTAVARTAMKAPGGKTVWLCSCLCGRIRFVDRGAILAQRVKSCGKACPFYKCAEILWGRQFNRLTVVDGVMPTRRHKRGRIYWWCACACGRERWVYQGALITRHIQSCGCLTAEKGAERLRELHQQRKAVSYE